MKVIHDPRHNARRLMLTILYSSPKSTDFKKIDIDPFIKALYIKSFDNDLLENLRKSIEKEYENIISDIDNTNSQWKYKDLLAIDKCILIIGVCEIKYLHTPIKIAIDEAIELGKEFSLPESTKFINGILANVIKNNK